MRLKIGKVPDSIVDLGFDKIFLRHKGFQHGFVFLDQSRELAPDFAGLGVEVLVDLHREEVKVLNGGFFLALDVLDKLLDLGQDLEGLDHGSVVGFQVALQGFRIEEETLEVGLFFVGLPHYRGELKTVIHGL